MKVNLKIEMCTRSLLCHFNGQSCQILLPFRFAKKCEKIQIFISVDCS